MTDKSVFRDITFPRKDIWGLSDNKYRIYTDWNNYIVIEAADAKAAIEKSGIKEPRRVLRDTIYLDNILKPEVAPTKPVQQAAPAQGDVASAISEAVANEAGEEVSAVVQSAPLTSEDVDKLLNS